MSEDTETEIEVLEVPGNYQDPTAQKMDAFGILALRLDKVSDPEIREAGVRS